VNDVGVIQSGSGFGLLHEAPPAIGIGYSFGQQQLERDKAVQAYRGP
jgi:hypothetical protein